MVGQHERGERRRAVGFAGEMGESLIVSPRVPNPGRGALGPSRPKKPVMCSITSFD